jgi:hypothetical protein
MSAPDSIIVYRNPAEAALWNAIMSGDPVIGYVLASILAFFVVFLVTNRLMNGLRLRAYKWKSRKASAFLFKYDWLICLTPAAVVAISLLLWLGAA